MGFRGRPIRAESGFLELTPLRQSLRLAVSSCVGTWDPHFSFSVFPILLAHSSLLLQGLASDFKDSLCLPLMVLAFLPLTRFFHQQPMVIFQYQYLGTPA